MTLRLSLAMIGEQAAGKKRLSREVFVRLCDRREQKREPLSVETSAPTGPAPAPGPREDEPQKVSLATFSSLDSYFPIGGSLFRQEDSQRVSLLWIASPSLSELSSPTSDRALCSDTNGPSPPSTEPLLSFIFASENASSSFLSLPPFALPLYRLCDQCPLLDQALLHKRFRAIAIFNFCDQSASLSICLNSLRSSLPTLLGCCGHDTDALSTLLAPISQRSSPLPVVLEDTTSFVSLLDSPSAWQYLRDENIDQIWAQVERLCEDMRSIPGESLVWFLWSLHSCSPDMRIKRKLYAATHLSCKCAKTLRLSS
jgi:hypothetical protein